MADIGTVLGAAQTLFAALECSVLKEVFSVLGYKSQLEDLRSTVETVQSVLLDAAASEELTHAARDYIQKLKAAVYDADDLFDEFRTLAERKQHKLKEGNQLSDKVRLFFSENPLKLAYKMSKEIKKIRKNLEGIAHDRTNFCFAVNSNRIRNRKQETCSYVNAPTVIGREADVEAIVDKLLNLNGEKGSRFLTVVGIGGMGKTTLAQLVCADQRVKYEFSSNLWWVCVADQDNNQFDKKAIISNILDLVTGTKNRDLSFEEVQKKLGLKLEGNKYLIVLDDLWNSDKLKWMELKDLLLLGAIESRIMVTTRSHDVAKAIGNSDVHELKGLSDENSWSLFELTAFEEKPDSQANALEVVIGKKIVKQCSNVPLAIKVVGSLLCGQGISKWQSFETSGLGGIGKGDNQIMSILKLSYHNLESSLKSCFTYCALFPKDYVIEKEMLIRLWTAQGYIVPFDRGQSIKDAGEEHFLILLRRCFFQDVEMDKNGNVESFKMHDLMHDVAQQVAGQEMLLATSETNNLADKVRHVFEGSSVREKNFYSNVKFRSYFRYVPWYETVVDLQLLLDKILTNGGCLRTLTLVNVGMKKLPDSIGELLHLRYLDLSNNYELETLPGSLTKLHNLETLQLVWCSMLRALPKKFSRLVNLMHLNIKDCGSIKYMPVGMHKPTSLCELTNFVVADESPSGDKRVGQLKDLKSLVANLKGQIVIKMNDDFKRADVYDWEGSCFEVAAHLMAVKFVFNRISDDDDVSKDEALLEKLLPHRNIKVLELWDYSGVRIPRWGGADYNWAAILPNLVSIDIAHCWRLKHLPMLSKLKYLKSLKLYDLDELEYIDDETSCSCAASTGAESKEESECTLFPCLESLDIRDVPKLKGIFEGVEFGDSNNNARLWPPSSFPRLTHLTIFPENFKTPGMQYLMTSLETLYIRRCDHMETLPEWIGMHGLSSLQSLFLEFCGKLKSIPKWVQNMASLSRLEMYGCRDELLRRCQEPHGEDWPIIKHIPNFHIYLNKFTQVLLGK